jgi:hypothetical protein
MAFEDRKFDLIAESDWKWWVIGKGVLTVQIVIGCHVYFQKNTENAEGSFWYKSGLSMYFSTIFQKLGFRIFQFSQ